MNRIHRSWAEIDRSALLHNLDVVRAQAGPNREVMAVVKADAYGHGLESIVAALAPAVEWFGVANVDEGLRAAAATPGPARIFLLGPTLPHEHLIAAERGFTVTLSTRDEIDAYGALGRPVTAHLSVDTGMGRIGCRPEEAAALAQLIVAAPNLTLGGFYTHFPSADEDADFTHDQIARVAGLLEGFGPIPQIHLSNSAGLLGFIDEQPFSTLVRPGLMLYGLSPLPAFQSQLRPVLSLKTRITLVRNLPPGHGISYGRTFVTSRQTRVATLAIGYGDGYPRHLSGQNAEVLVRGRRCPVLGRITMDQIMVDVSEVDPAPAPGEIAVLIGEDGPERILASELAERSGTIPWEILTGITRRVDRVYP